MKMNRRQFLQGLAAGLAVASMPASMPLEARTAEATKAMGAEGWRFIVRGGSAGYGDSLVMLAPGVHFNPLDDWPGRVFMYPEVFDPQKLIGTEINRPITLMPWSMYAQPLMDLLSKDQRDKLARLTRRRR